jgi:hypothetical protein
MGDKSYAGRDGPFDVALLPVICYHISMPYERLTLHCLPLAVCVFLGILLTFLASCALATPISTPTPDPTPTPTFTPSPTLIPSPTPTATPIPPLVSSIHWPERVSALEPVFIEVELVPPPDVGVTATVRASVTGPGGQPRRSFDLMPREGNRYAAAEPLYFPLEPPEGNWLLVVYVRSALEVAGERHLAFRPDPIQFRNLADVLPVGVDVRVPQDFVELLAEGDRWAGGRVWRLGGAEMGLWWAPGPAEPLLLNNAVVMLEATYDPKDPPDVLDVEELEWQGQMAFLFREDWSRMGGGPAEAWVVQGPDHWLYVLRMRTLGDEDIPLLLRQVWETFTFIEE